MKNLSPKDLQNLETALNYMLMGELKAVCAHYNITCFGKKGEIIKQILHFVKSGKNLTPQSIPEVSKAKKGTTYSLHPNAPILMGSYKNDENTRNFMKKLIGEHFHFTSFGQDWIKDRWLSGKPPTYQEFADFWQKEYATRKQKPARPKKEWAYLNFTQRYLRDVPDASRKEIAEAWKKERILQMKKAKELLKKALES